MDASNEYAQQATFRVTLFHMLRAIAQFETEIRAERRMDGIERARARGVRFGRHTSLSQEQLVALRERHDQGARIGTLMRAYGLSKATVYRYLRSAPSAFEATTP